jgi:hypothetical protein
LVFWQQFRPSISFSPFISNGFTLCVGEGRILRFSFWFDVSIALASRLLKIKERTFVPVVLNLIFNVGKCPLPY